MWCHMVFYVTVVPSLMTLLLNKFTSIVIDDWNLDKIYDDYSSKVWYIMTLTFSQRKIVMNIYYLDEKSLSR